MEKRWKVSTANRDLQDVLVKGLGLRPLTAQLLINRGLVDCDAASSFLKPSLGDLHDPLLLKDMSVAVERIVEAIGKREKIAVFGDYDVDGTTAAALLFLFFEEIGFPVDVCISERKEGYGLNVEAVKRLHASGTTLLITTDCGITDHEAIGFARSLGVDVIVTDHHEPGPDLPPALAVIDPKRKDCRFPFKSLAGVGVAFNLLMALRAALRRTGFPGGREPNLRRLLDMVAIGTVADMVPLTGENRVFVKFGLDEMRKRKRPGVAALMEAAGIKEGALDAGHIAFRIAPRLNAAGRIAVARTAFELLTTKDEKEAARLAERLDRTNAERQRLEEEIFGEALAMLRGLEHEKGIVLHSERWHPGVIGIVASRLVERFSKPVVLMAVEGAWARGSARGVKAFDMVEALRASATHLERYGGHRAAAGLTVKGEEIGNFRAAFFDYLERTLTDVDLTPEMELDSAVSLDEMDLGLVEEIGLLAPFGTGNREPVLFLSDARVVAAEVVGGRHLKLRLGQNGRVIGGIGFGMAGLHPLEGDGFSVAFSPYIDDWGGIRRPRLKIRDLKKGVKHLDTGRPE